MISTQEMFSRKYTAAANMCVLPFDNKVKDNLLNIFNYFLMTNVYNRTVKM